MKFLKNFSNSSLTFYLFTTLVITAITWSIVFKIDTSVLVIGELIPQGRSVKIQNRYQGKITEVFAEVGQQVQKNDLLIAMETSVDESELIETSIDLQILTIQKRRLMAQVEEDPDLFKRGSEKSEFFEDQRRILISEIEAHRQQLLAIREELDAAQSEIDSSPAVLSTLKEGLELAKSKENLVNELYKNGYEGELALLEARQNASEARQAIVAHNIRIQNLTGQIEASKASIRARKAEFLRMTSNELSEVERRLQLTTARKKSLEAKIKEFTITAAQSGLISKENIKSAGEVIQPGTVLMELIPEGIPNVFQGKLPVSDALDVFGGQKARVTLVTMDTRNDEPLDATVEKVDPDVTTADDGSKYYGITLRFEKPFAQTRLPGVTGSAFLLTGQRSVLEYLAEPIFDTLSKALKD